MMQPSGPATVDPTNVLISMMMLPVGRMQPSEFGHSMLPRSHSTTSLPTMLPIGLIQPTMLLHLDPSAT